MLPLPPAGQPPPLPHDATYGYQKRNVRNFILFLRAQLAGHKEWMDWQVTHNLTVCQQHDCHEQPHTWTYAAAFALELGEVCNRCQFEDEGVNCMLEEDDGFLGPAKADPLPWDVLDNGADQTGAQMQLLTPFINGQVCWQSDAVGPL